MELSGDKPRFADRESANVGVPFVVAQEDAQSVTRPLPTWFAGVGAEGTLSKRCYKINRTTTILKNAGGKGGRWLPAGASVVSFV